MRLLLRLLAFAIVLLCLSTSFTLTHAESSSDAPLIETASIVNEDVTKSPISELTTAAASIQADPMPTPAENPNTITETELTTSTVAVEESNDVVVTSPSTTSPADAPDAPDATETSDTDIAVVATTADDACASCCGGGSCSYAPSTSSSSSTTTLRFVQCCGKIRNQPKCCHVNREFGLFSTSEVKNEKCEAQGGEYVCKDVRPLYNFIITTSYVSPAGVIVIALVGGLILCCYCAMAGRRSYAGYSGQPMYGGGGGGGGGELCAACLAGFCCTELCCTGNINF